MSKNINEDKLLDHFCGHFDCEECDSFQLGKCTELVSYRKIRNIVERMNGENAYNIHTCKHCRFFNPAVNGFGDTGPFGTCSVWNECLCGQSDYCSYWAGNKNNKGDSAQ